ncbi:SHOCT domain-containing protein [Agromyces atrinae]|uniref:SHOCT domain-containing protein n=1 Tax=Agromyces atrinae TaxID=592376 RepID=UPI001F59C24D|nr:SHOCT domain-containing protein [Agromyces atrinae]MCI2959134.1 SHOCT domain-containing protein [Agromyces atrinae]
MDENPIHTFTSHIGGKNATVQIYVDRVEWVRPRGISGGKITAGVMTLGMSTLVTGVKNGKSGTEMIPIRSISSVTTKRDGMLNSFVQVITTGNAVEFRVSHKEAAAVKDTLTRLMLGTHPALTTRPAPEVVTAQATTHPDISAQLTSLAALRDAGVLTEAEFTAKKSDLLSRM